MGEFGLIFQIVGGLLFIFFIFVTVMNTKTWRWLHVTAMFLVFAASIALAPLAALALKTRFNWVRAHAELTKKVSDAEKEYHTRIHGDPSNPQIESLIALRNEYSRFILDRGRILRSLQPALNADGTVTLQLAAAAAAPMDPAAAGAPPPGAPPGGAPPAGAPPAGAAPAAPTPTIKNTFKAQEVVFAFLERQDASGIWVPGYYVGQFEVTAATDTSLTLRKTVPAGPVTGDEAQPQNPWTVAETLPPDMHEVFNFPPEERQAKLAELLPPQQLPASATPEARQLYAQLHAKMLDSYVRDGQPATDTDPPENVWIYVEFLREHTIDVDAESPVSPITADNFDSLGKAQVPRLQRKGPVKFAKGEIGLFDSQTANTLITNGIAKLPDPSDVAQPLIFRRRLNHYENAFATIARQISEIQAAIARADRHLAALKVAIERANEQIRLLEADKSMLAADQGKIDHERTQLATYRTSLETRVAEVRAELSRLYGANRRLGEEIKAASQQLTEEIDRRTREATASTP